MRLAVAILSRIPLGFASVICWALAWAWWTVVPIRKRETVARLHAALPEVPAGPTLRRMTHDLCLGYVELLQFDRVHLELDAPADLRGSLLLSGHAGSWDAVLLRLGDAFPLAIFLKTPSDPWTRDFMLRMRTAHGVRALETGATMRDAYACLDEGLNVMFIQDQRYNNGVESPFFGEAALTSLGLAAAVRRTGRPVYGCWQWRVGTGRHHIEIRPLAVDATMSPQEITDRANAWYEARIRERPHGWFWLHRRWKGAARAKSPERSEAREDRG